MLNKFSLQLAMFIVLLFFMMLAGFGSVTTVQANTTYAGTNRQKDCAVAVQSGWRPYRVGASDTLSALAAQANVSVELLTATNCLKSDQLSAGDLVLVPIQTIVTAPAVDAAVVAAAPAAGAAQPLLQVISTTSTVATVNVAAPQERLAPQVQAMTASPFSAANLIAVAILLLGVMAMLFFGLRPRAADAPLVQSVFSIMGNGIFLFAGVLIGVILFPVVNTAAVLSLPTAVSATIAVTLIALLVAKELFFNGRQWRTLNRLLNLGIAPLLMIFFLTVASRMVGGMN